MAMYTGYTIGMGSTMGSLITLSDLYRQATLGPIMSERRKYTHFIKKYNEFIHMYAVPWVMVYLYSKGTVHGDVDQQQSAKWPKLPGDVASYTPGADVGVSSLWDGLGAGRVARRTLQMCTGHAECRTVNIAVLAGSDGRQCAWDGVASFCEHIMLAEEVNEREASSSLPSHCRYAGRPRRRGAAVADLRPA